MRKKRLLIVNEFSELYTGFSTYMKYLLPILYKTGKYEIAELGCYIRDGDPAIYNVPWQVYGNLPKTKAEEQIFAQSHENQMGKWKFDEVCLDFKPDLVITIRDPWFDAFINQSHFRKFFKFLWMATIDSEPLKPEWVEDLKNTDYVMTYSEYGKYVLEGQTGGGIKVCGVASPGADPEVYKPSDDKKALRKSLFLPEDAIIFGTVMRSQPRKLFPELMRAFVKFLELCKANGRDDIAEKSYLYLHTAVIDVGWDMAAEIKRHKLGRKIIFTYHCRNCKLVHPSHYASEHTVCPRCKQPALITPGTSCGVTREELSRIMQAFDLYIQYATNEGWGMGINDAKACGVPCIGTDYSAMAEQWRNGGGIPVKVAKLYQEPLQQTNQIRAYPDNDHCAEIMYDFAVSSPEEKKRLSQEARNCVLENYSWEKIAKVWEDVIDKAEVYPEGHWTQPPQIISGRIGFPQNLSNLDFVRACFTLIAQEPEKANSLKALKIFMLLNQGYEVQMNEKGVVSSVAVNRDQIVNYFINYVEQKNRAEQIRANVLLGAGENQVTVSRL